MLLPLCFLRSVDASGQKHALWFLTPMHPKYRPISQKLTKGDRPSCVLALPRSLA